MWMQQTLVRMKRERAGGAAPDRDHVRGIDALEAARNVVGQNAVVGPGRDLDGDGAEERTVFRPATSEHSPELTSLLRLAVLSPTTEGNWRILLDTNRTTDLPPLPQPVAVWRATSLVPNAIELDGGAANPTRVRFVWSGSEYVVETRTGPPPEVEATPALDRETSPH